MKCPQQSNATDCGLFLLEFMEYFFIHRPLTDFQFPLDLSDWFNPEEVLGKRHKISEVMKEKIDAQNVEPIELPNIILFKENDPDLQTPAVDCDSQINNNNGNFEEVNSNNNNDENGNNNEEEFNNNNDFYEANHNDVDANMVISNVESIAVVHAEQVQDPRIETMDANEDACGDQYSTTDDEDDVKNDATGSKDSVDLGEKPSDIVEQSNTTREPQVECIIELDDDEEDDKATHGGSSPDVDDEEMVESYTLTNDISDSTLNQIL